MPSKTKLLAGITGLLLLAALSLHGEILGIPHALAQDNVVTDTQGSIMGVLLFAVGSLNFLAFFLLKILSYLVDPDTIFGVSSGSAGIMLRLWQISRDIMNLIFAIMLLGGAIMTIVLGKQEIVKQHLVKFILAVILVNFSWFFPRVVFDIANVTTATIYGLPNLVNSQCQWVDKDNAIKNCVVVNHILFMEDSTKACPAVLGGTELPMAPVMKVCLAPLQAGTNNGFGILNGLVANHARLMYLGVIVGSPPTGGTGGTVAETLRFTLALVMVTFLHVMLVFPLLALTMVMIVRIPILWLTVAFMPFMFIGFVIGDKFIKVNSMEIFTKHFVTAAFLPALVAVPLSIGFIMLNEVARLSPSMTPPPGLEDKIPFAPEVGNLWQFIWVLLAFMVMWVGSHWAMKRDEIYSRFTEPIFNVGKSFLKLPVTTPFIPHDTTGDGKADRKSSFQDMFQNFQHSGLPFGKQNNFQPGAPGAAPAGQSGAQDPKVIDALTKINAGTGVLLPHEIELLRQDIRKNNKDPSKQPSIREYLTDVKTADSQASQQLSGIQSSEIENLATKLSNALNPNPGTPNP